MLQILNIDTKEIIALDLIDRKTNCSWISDFIGNAGGFGKVENGLIECVDNEPNYVAKADTETLAWWQNTVELQKQLDELVEQYGSNEVLNAIQNISSSDLDLDIELKIDAINTMLQCSDPTFH